MVERARLKRTPTLARGKDRLYLFNLSLVLLTTGCLGAYSLSTERGSHHIREDGACDMSMNERSLVGAIVVNAGLELYFTSLFAVPLYSGKWLDGRLRRLALRTVIAAVLTTASSIANLSALLSHGSHELAWVCMATCSLDTVFSAVVLASLTGNRDADESRPITLGARSAAATVCSSSVGLEDRKQRDRTSTQARPRMDRIESNDSAESWRDAFGPGGMMPSRLPAPSAEARVPERDSLDLSDKEDDEQALSRPSTHTLARGESSLPV